MRPLIDNSDPASDNNTQPTTTNVNCHPNLYDYSLTNQLKANVANVMAVRSRLPLSHSVASTRLDSSRLNLADDSVELLALLSSVVISHRSYQF